MIFMQILDGDLICGKTSHETLANINVGPGYVKPAE